MRYMVVEKFKPNQAKAIYQRFRKHGRMLPEGLSYLDSWISADLTLCFQLMESEDELLFDQWISQWKDLMEFEVIRVVSSVEASSAVFGSDE